MNKLIVPLPVLDGESLSQLRYALAFASEDITSWVINEAESAIEAEIKPGASEIAVREKIDALVRRYSQTEFGLRSVVDYQHDRDLPVIDAWEQLLEKKWVTLVGTGHVILRGPAARLLQMIDAKVQRVFGGHFGAEPEVYPATIRCESLDRCNHFASCPEHIDFGAHAPAARCGRVEEILELLPREWLVGWAARWSDERKRSRHQSILLRPLL